MRETLFEPKAKQVDLYVGFTNKITGEHFRWISETRDSITFHWTVQPQGCVPFEHIHINEDEIFHIRYGEGRIGKSLGWEKRLSPIHRIALINLMFRNF